MMAQQHILLVKITFFSRPFTVHPVAQFHVGNGYFGGKHFSHDGHESNVSSVTRDRCYQWNDNGIGDGYAYNRFPLRHRRRQ